MQSCQKGPREPQILKVEKQTFWRRQMENEIIDLDNMRKVVKLALIKIGLRCDMIGFDYLCYGIEKVIEEPQQIHNLCKGLYVDIAKKFNLENVACVERNIRHCIDNTLDEKSFSRLNEMFHTLLYAIDEKPTVGELIRLMAEYYLLGLYME